MHHFVVTTVSTGLSVSMDGVQVLNYTTVLPPYVLIGFTGATGGFTDIHQVQNVAITAGPPPPVPTVTGVSPASGPSTGGTTVRSPAADSTSASAVNFGNTPATAFLVQNDAVVTATAPAGKLGAVDVTVTTAGGTTTTGAADKFTYTVPPLPTVTGVSPASGSSTGGTTVTVTGTGLTGASAVKFGAGNPAIFFNVNSPTSATVTVPSGQVGTVDVTVTTPGGTSTATRRRSLHLHRAAPARGERAEPDLGTERLVGDGHRVELLRRDRGEVRRQRGDLHRQQPDHDLRDRPDGIGHRRRHRHDARRYDRRHGERPLHLHSAERADRHSAQPGLGIQRHLVSVTGTNFTGASSVHFGANAASFTVNSDTSITATGPAGAGTVDVTVTTTGGTSATGAADQFTYSAGPPPPTQVATYRGDLARTGWYPNETGLTAANVKQLKLHWTATGGTSSFAQPIIANNLVYWGDWGGFVHATTLAGTDVWKVNIGVTTDEACSPSTAGVSGTVTAGVMNGTPVVYVPGGDGDMYALDALTGALIWKTNLGAPPAVYLWASPILYNGSIYKASRRSATARSSRGKWCSWTRRPGAIQHLAKLVPDGCVGAGVWTSPAIDPSDGSVYVTTGTPNSCHFPGPALAPSIVKLRATDLTILSSWTVPASEQVFGDEDFGGTPTLFTATINGTPARSWAH